MSGDELVVIAAGSPKIILKLFFTYLRFKRKVKRAAKVFRKELIRRGIPKGTATMLVDEFKAASEVLSIRNLRSMF